MPKRTAAPALLPADPSAAQRRIDPQTTYPTHDDATTPQWLTDALIGSYGLKRPAWVVPALLPPIVVEGRRLNDAQVAQVIGALQQSTLNKPHRLLTALNSHASRQSLDSFAWALFEDWQAEGAVAKEKWAMTALGLLGGDAVVTKLVTLIKQWPGQSLTARATYGLECLRAIGTDAALIQINSIAQRTQFKGLRGKAEACIQAIAGARGLSRTQLEDRIVPDYGLSADGTTIFDYGARQFRFVLGPELVPMLRDATGKGLTDLPKPGAKDDALLAKQARESWTLLKKQIREVARIQAGRLEDAMMTGRTWPRDEFETLIVHHPFMSHLARLLVWCGYGDAGNPAATFRVTEDLTFADQKDDDFVLDRLARVGVAHPIQMDRTTIAAWGDIFGDYQIIAPFAQLTRRVYSIDPVEHDGAVITRFEDKEARVVPGIVILEKLGWRRGGDGGQIQQHTRRFEEANVTAVLHYSATWFSYYQIDSPLLIERAFFVAGIVVGEEDISLDKAVPLRDVPPILINNVLSNVNSIVRAKRDS